MGIRETLNNKPRLAVGLAAGLLVVGVAIIAVQLSSGNSSDASTKAFFTIDDGRTWFTDSAGNVPPFQRDGKEAVRAYVFECDGKQFVNHMERYNAAAKKVLDKAATVVAAGDAPASPEVQQAMGGRQVKKPGTKEWIPAGNFARAGAVVTAKCPNGDGKVTPVEP